MSRVLPCTRIDGERIKQYKMIARLYHQLLQEVQVVSPTPSRGAGAGLLPVGEQVPWLIATIAFHNTRSVDA